MSKPKDMGKVKGGWIRAAKLSPARRLAIARKAARARWRKHPKGTKGRSAAGFKSWATRRASPDYIQHRSGEARTRRKR